jgi:DNA-binding transcriptional regulator YbjK
MTQKPQQAPELASRLQKTNEELKNLQDSVKTGMINVKALMDFRTAVEQARQASAAVQRWLESQGKGNDPYQLMAQVMKQRVEMTTQLVKDVTRDLESLDLDFDTPGLPALNQAVRTLAERLEKLFPH